MSKLLVISLLFLSSASFAEPITGGLTKLGVLANAGTSFPVDVWSSGAYVFPIAAAATTIVSSSTDDSGAGTGARIVHVTGLSSGNAIIEEDINLQGTAAQTLVNQYLRINDVSVTSGGTVLSNSGAIQVKHSSTVIAEIPIGYGKAPMAIFTAPKKGRITGWSASIYNIATISHGTFQLQVKPYLGVWQTVAEMGVSTLSQNSFSQSFDAPIEVAKFSDVRIRVKTVSANSTSVSAKFDFKQDIY